MKIAVFCPNLIGDTVMATPAIRALRRGFAEATLVGLIKPHVAPTLGGSPWFDDLIFFDPRSSDPNVRTRSHIWYASYNTGRMGVDFAGATPFWRAAYALDVDAMRLLVRYGADPSIPTMSFGTFATMRR